MPDCHSDHRRLRLRGGRLSLEAGGGQPILSVPHAADDQIQRNEDKEDAASGRRVRLWELGDELGSRDEAVEAGHDDHKLI